MRDAEKRSLGDPSAESPRSSVGARSTRLTASSTSAARKPVAPWSMISGIEPSSNAIVGVPHIIASTTERPNGSAKAIGWSSASEEPRTSARSAGPTEPR